MEPKPIGSDNCMREGIETKPLPLLDIGNIDLVNKNPSPLRTMKTMSKPRQFRNALIGNQTQRVKGTSKPNKYRNTQFAATGRQSFVVGVGDLVEDDERDSFIDGDEDDNFDTRSARSKAMSIRSGVSRTKRNTLQAKMASLNKAENQSIKSSKKDRRSPLRTKREEE